MKLTISEIKEKAEVGDKFDFPAIVEKVYQMQKKDLQYAIGIQNVVVKDDSDKITVGMFIKTEEDAFNKDLEGKKVQVSGEYSTFQKNGKLYKNISKGKILIQEEDKPENANNSKSSQSQQVFATHNITPEQIRIECLKITLKHSEILKDTKSDTQDLINNAKMFEKYVTGNKIEGAVNTPEKAMEKAGLLKEKKEEKSEDPDLAEKVKKINYIMELAEENQSMEAVDDFIKKCGQEDIKELTLKQLETLVKKLETTLPDESKIPF
jgi:hypothetical protein